MVALNELPGRDQVRALFLAQAYQGAECLTQLDGEGVVVDVDVRHEEVADVAQLVSDLPQPGG